MFKTKADALDKAKQSARQTDTSYRVYQDDGLDAEWIIGINRKPGRLNLIVHPPDQEGNQKIDEVWEP